MLRSCVKVLIYYGDKLSKLVYIKPVIRISYDRLYELVVMI